MDLVPLTRSKGSPVVAGRRGIDVKFEHALGLAAVFESTVAAFLADPANGIRVEKVVDAAGDLVHRVTSVPSIPEAWSLMMGDAIHNGRSALDHLAWRLVEQGGGSPGRDTCFPIADREQGYGDRLRTGLRGAPSSVRTAVKNLRPWHGGDDQLWALHELDVIDKHRLLVPVAAAPLGVEVAFNFLGFPDDPPLPEPLVTKVIFRAADRPFPLRVGDVVFSEGNAALRAAETTPTSGITHSHTPAFEFVFGHDTRLAGEEAIGKVRTLVEHARAMVEPLVSMVA